MKKKQDHYVIYFMEKIGIIVRRRHFQDVYSIKIFLGFLPAADDNSYLPSDVDNHTWFLKRKAHKIATFNSAVK